MSDVKPAIRGRAVTPHDTNDNSFRALYIGVSGDVVVVLQGDSAPVTFKSVPIGILPISTKLITTGTTAGSIIGLL